ncbi:hypothetical protein TrLO_g15137 [Triparma laevis f. longispina]|uniref:RING-type domain-containing protein n=1 Tax=Triparma laevis f. longispina TaxID=1714387 RepID=A0A9W7F8R7_9STRA|nr:hypothetical protein TrLO_g15137 [Triparma laevis f. longispina]
MVNAFPPAPADCTCVICREACKSGRMLRCGHGFCAGCLRMWMGQSSRCPTCRREIGMEWPHPENNNDNNGQQAAPAQNEDQAAVVVPGHDPEPQPNVNPEPTNPNPNPNPPPAVQQPPTPQTPAQTPQTPQIPQTPQPNLSAIKQNLNPTTTTPTPTPTLIPTHLIPTHLTPKKATPSAVTSAQKLYRTLSAQKGRPLTPSETEDLIAETITTALSTIKQSPYPCIIRSTKPLTVTTKENAEVGVVMEGTSMVGIEGEGGRIRTVLGWVEESGVEYLQGGGIRKKEEWRIVE